MPLPTRRVLPRRLGLCLCVLVSCDKPDAVGPTDPEPRPAATPRIPDTAMVAEDASPSCPEGQRWVVYDDVGECQPVTEERVESGPYEDDTWTPPSTLRNVRFVESRVGKPRVLGCADGQREAFANVSEFPGIAGCLGAWDDTASLRDPPTGNGCGDDSQRCKVPADVCAAGWHVCAANGWRGDLKERLSASECVAAGPGRFNAAVSHSPTDEIEPCPRVTWPTMLPCVSAGIGSESVCCGEDCRRATCPNGVWPNATRVSPGTAEGCGAVSSDANGGVLCCRDPIVVRPNLRPPSSP
jgi:hypothetical protein